ncbi:hypothetical protein DH2020_026682 [Rehmannia glutinosa]|uniref:poly(A)-specific ribonuclease n=1 Tax=Rehmannia glutinosa TaxID=99300 RepID=A0ABR0W039_REHGL
MSLLPKSDSIQIREVWANNLDEELDLIRDVVDEFPYIAMDTEFPGIVLRPVGNFKNANDYHYQTLKENVNLLKLIQLGLTFSDGNGNLPTCGTNKSCIWQFNFREFNPNEDVFANDSIELLSQSGIDLLARGLNKLAELLEVERVGVCHQAGSDSLLTCCTFMKLKGNFFSGSMEKYAGVLYGLGIESG